MRTVRQLFDLSGRTALVTGGSRGLGLQIAEALGEQGARLLLVARRQPELEAAVARLRQQGIAAEAYAVDLASEDAVAPLVAEAMRVLGHIDILVNNAGTCWVEPAETHPLHAWDKVMNLNMRSVFLLTQAVANASMIPQQGGRIINIASIAGLAGNAPGTVQTIAYNSAKGALVNFTRALAGEWGGHGITVNAIAPGFFRTRMSQGAVDQLGAERLAGHTPLRRLGDDEDLKGAALLFASDAGKHITGQILAVDGGMTAVV